MTYTPSQKFYYDKVHFLNYKIVGNGHISVVMIHGFGASLETWSDILPYFDLAKYRFVLVDLKGAGFSSKPKHTDYSMVEQSRLIGELIDYLHLQDYYLAGHSFGGGVALLNTIDAVIAGKRLPRGLILIDAAVYKTKLPFFVYYLRIPLLGKIICNLIPPNIQAKYTLHRIFHDRSKVNEALVLRYSFFVKLEGYGNALRQIAGQIIPKNFRLYTDRYEDIDIQTLIIWGRQDSALPHQSGERLANALQNSTLKIIDNCGHNAQEEQPEIVAGFMIDFIEKGCR